MYNKPIMLTYKGKPNFKTCWGGFFSTLGVGVMLYFWIIILKTMFLKEKITANRNSLFKDLSKDKTIHKFGKSGTRLAIKITNSIYGGAMNESFYELKIDRYETNNGLDGLPYDGKTKTTLETSPWNITNFGDYNATGHRSFDGIGSYFWVSDPNELYAYGTERGEHYSGIEIFIDYWQTKENCVDPLNSINFLGLIDVEVLIISPYFDFYDMDNPIKYHIDDRLKFYGVQYDTKLANVYIRENKYQLNDDIFEFESKSGVFYSASDFRLQQIKHYQSDQYNNTYVVPFILQIEADPQVDEYERQVLTFLDATGNI